MLRERAADKGIGAERDFRWRGAAISRVEGLSDAVFAFAVTLLVVSLQVPQTFGATIVRHEVALYECGGRKAAIRRVSTPVPNPDVRRW